VNSPVESVLLLYVEYNLQNQMVRRLTSSCIAIIATLVYGSIIYPGHRRAKAHQPTLDHERYDRFYDGPYSEHASSKPITKTHNRRSRNTLRIAPLSMGRVQRVPVVTCKWRRGGSTETNADIGMPTKGSGRWRGV
jgi:hypothetical protein